ncbi:EVE domain-containing protein [candidate division GN15 bacterium]|nr:EVE domain-containing protein [candidate division GN15 bacterium]
MAKRYWLFKSEPDCFSIEDLAASPDQTAHWDGVRNYQARNLLRDDVKKGDEVLFYHSSAKPTGIAGLCVVSRAGYPDHTAWDPDSEHFDPKARPDNPIWYMVDVTLKKKLPETLPLKVLKETAGLEEMMVTQRGARLSVQPVRPNEWKIIRKLLRDYL